MAAGRRSTSRCSRIRTRSYFGIYEVTDSANAGSTRMLTHGTTLHGIQYLAAGLETLADHLLCAAAPASAAHACRATGFMAPNAADRRRRARRGHALLLRDAEPGWTVLRDRSGDGADRAAASSPSSRAARRRCRSVIGDARLSAWRASRPHSLDMLAVDAFSSDAVPMHLLTREALGSLRPRGAAARPAPGPHLEPLSGPEAGARRQCRMLGWSSALMVNIPTAAEHAHEETASAWVVLSRDPAAIRQLIAASGKDSISGSRSSAGPASPAGATIMPASCPCSPT